MGSLLLGIVLTLQGLILLNIISISATVMGILYLVTGIIWIVQSLGVVLPAVPTVHRRVE